MNALDRRFVECRFKSRTCPILGWTLAMQMESPAGWVPGLTGSGPSSYIKYTCVYSWSWVLVKTEGQVPE